VKHHPFDYLAVMKFLQNEVLKVPPTTARAKLLEVIIPYTGLIERVFLGELSVQDLKYLQQENGQQLLTDTIDIAKVILAYKIKTSPSIQVVAYIVSRQGRFYEIDLASSKTKSIEPRKRTTRDIGYFGKGLGKLSLQDAKKYMLSLNTKK